MTPNTYLAVDLLDRVTQHRSWTVDNYKKDQSRQRTLAELLPEDIMDGLDELAGDGMGKVTVGASLTHSKEFGNKAEAFVSFSVTCNNSLEDMQKAHHMVQPLVRDLVNEDLRAMIVDRDAYLSGSTTAVSPGPAAARKALAPPPGAGKPRVGKPPVKSEAKTAPPPSFRR